MTEKVETGLCQPVWRREWKEGALRSAHAAREGILAPGLRLALGKEAAERLCSQLGIEALKEAHRVCTSGHKVKAPLKQERDEVNLQR